MKTIAYTLFVIITITVAYFVSKPQNDRYNRYMCATQGYKADCVTPLSQEERLK